MTTRCSNFRRLAAASSLVLVAGASFGQDLPVKPRPVPMSQVAPAAAQPAAFGYRTSVESVRMTLGASAAEAAGKGIAIDPATGEAIVDVTRYYLPEAWIVRPDVSDVGVDSYGRPLVSEPMGWPGWAQEDVDALRAVIATRRDQLAQLAASGADTREMQALLGNFIGQAIVRGIEIGDVVNLADAAVMTPGVAGSAIERMHAYEQDRFEESGRSGAAYTPSTYAKPVVDFLTSQQTSLEAVLAINTGQPAGGIVDRAAPSGCYVRVPGQGLGFNALVDPVILWSGDGTDDAAVDLPLGFPMYFYQCEDADLNFSVRVSTNGYLTFYEQGGDATNGVEWVNVPIGAASAPDGFVAGYWDDLQVLSQSAIVDTVSYKVQGSPGNRIMTVEYLSISRRGGNTDDYHTFQIQLSERHPDLGNFSGVKLMYGELGTWWLADTLDEATVGMEGFAGTAGECLESCALLTTVPANNYNFVPQANDLCPNARPIFDGSSFSGDLAFAYADGGACLDGVADHWYRFDAACNGTLTLRTCGTHDIGGVDAGLDTVLAAYSACPGNAASLIICNDDGGTDCGDQNVVRDSKLTVNVTGGQSYWIRVAAFSAVTATKVYLIQADFDASGAAPANDTCANAQVVAAPQFVIGNLLCATSDGDASCYAWEPQRDVWYRFTAGIGGTLRAQGCGTHDRLGIDAGLDLTLSIHSGCPGTDANTMACEDDESVNPCSGDYSISYDPRISAAVADGQTVYIRVANFPGNAADGTFYLGTYFLTADITGDCRVDLTDLAYLLTNFGQATGADLIDGDIDGDDAVTLADLAYLLTNFGATCP